MTSVFAPAPLPRREPGPARHLRPDPGAVVRPQRRPEVAPRPHLRVVQPGERTMRRLTPFGGVVLTALVFAVLAALVGAHTLIAQGQMRLDSLDRKVQDEQARYQQLRKQVAEAESPDRIVAAAEAQGMVSPTDLVYLQPATDDAGSAGLDDAEDRADGAGSDRAERETASSWSTVKPLLEVPAP
jgi:cell division protein FtsL